MSTSPLRKTRRAADRRKARRSVGGPPRPIRGAVIPPATFGRQSCPTLQWRAFLKATTAISPSQVPWYGMSPAWRVALEAAARREFGDRLLVTESPGRLEYRIALDVHGPGEMVDVTVRFYANPPYDTYGLAPSDYPRVWAERGATSKHRMPDDALCLYYPADPAGRRWTADKGLLDLLDIVVDHLGFEAYWRATGGPDGGVWLGAEAEHGFDQRPA